MQNIRAITFDLDDTLWEIHPVIRRAEKALYDWLGENYPRITGQFDSADMRDVRAQILADNPQRSHDLTFLRFSTLTHVAAAAGYEPDFIDEAFSVFDAVRNDVDIFPGVRSTLQKLSERYRLVAVTNGNANLEKIGIAHLFDELVTAGNVGAAKPAREIFDAAIAAAGASAADTLHVGDHPDFDVLGAISAGMPAAWLNRTGDSWSRGEAAPHIEIAHVRELLPLLQVDQ